MSQIIPLLILLTVLAALVFGAMQASFGGPALMFAGLSLGVTVGTMAGGWSGMAAAFAISWGVLAVVAFVAYLIEVAFEKGKASR